jgi:hypothetical protein
MSHFQLGLSSIAHCCLNQMLFEAAAVALLAQTGFSLPSQTSCSISPYPDHPESMQV